MNLNSIPAFDDNYTWVLSDEAGHCLIIDPGDAEPVLDAVSVNSWQPKAILLTHRHHDHVGGVKELMEKFLQIVVHGPQETQDKGTTQIIKDDETAFVSGCEFSVITIPGHTLGHTCCFSKPYLFRGDTLFSGRCDRLLEGTPSQMYQSIKKLSALPDDTLVCCAHEYTLSNMRFALNILSHDLSINDYYRKVKELRIKNQITLSVTLKSEQQINVFLRTEGIDLVNITSKETLLQQPEEHFAWLRLKEDRF